MSLSNLRYRNMTNPDGSLNRAAVRERIRYERWLHRISLRKAAMRAREALGYELAYAKSVEARDNALAAHLAANAEIAREDAETLAAFFQWNTDTLRVMRDRWHYSNSTRRHIELPRYELALKLARERQAKKEAA